MNKLQLLTRTNNNFTAVYFQENWFLLKSGGTVELHEYTLIQADCDTQISSKTKGTGEVCFNIKNKWCLVVPVESQLCSLMLKTLPFLCKPFSSLWEFASIIVGAVYIPPSGNNKWHAMPTIRTDNKN